MTKYFIYCRKSTEDEERQVMSIEAQLVELAEYAKRENLEIIEKFVEKCGGTPKNLLNSLRKTIMKSRPVKLRQKTPPMWIWAG